MLDSVNPSQSSRVVGQAALAERRHAAAAVAAARAAFPAWAATPAADRAAILIKAAAIMRSRRFELAAWEIFECGKPWAEADADVAEAIDFCEFYAREMIRLAEPRHRDAAGRDQFYRAHPARRGRGHPPLELPAGDPHRHDGGRARGGQHGRSSSRPSNRPSSPGSSPACSTKPVCRRAC